MLSKAVLEQYINILGAHITDNERFERLTIIRQQLAVIQRPSVAVIGDSGSGKSSLVSSLAIHHPTLLPSCMSNSSTTKIPIFLRKGAQEDYVVEIQLKPIGEWFELATPLIYPNDGDIPEDEQTRKMMLQEILGSDANLGGECFEAMETLYNSLQIENDVLTIHKNTNEEVFEFLARFTTARRAVGDLFDDHFSEGEIPEPPNNFFWPVTKKITVLLPNHGPLPTNVILCDLPGYGDPNMDDETISSHVNSDYLICVFPVFTKMHILVEAKKLPHTLEMANNKTAKNVYIVTTRCDCITPKQISNLQKSTPQSLLKFNRFFTSSLHQPQKRNESLNKQIEAHNTKQDFDALCNFLHHINDEYINQLENIFHNLNELTMTKGSDNKQRCALDIKSLVDEFTYELPELVKASCLKILKPWQSDLPKMNYQTLDCLQRQCGSFRSKAKHTFQLFPRSQLDMNLEIWDSISKPILAFIEEKFRYFRVYVEKQVPKQELNSFLPLLDSITGKFKEKLLLSGPSIVRKYFPYQNISHFDASKLINDIFGYISLNLGEIREEIFCELKEMFDYALSFSESDSSTIKFIEQVNSSLSSELPAILENRRANDNLIPVPDFYELRKVPGDGNCLYSSLLLAIGEQAPLDAIQNFRNLLAEYSARSDNSILGQFFTITAQRRLVADISTMGVYGDAHIGANSFDSVFNEAGTNSIHLQFRPPITVDANDGHYDPYVLSSKINSKANYVCPNSFKKSVDLTEAENIRQQAQNLSKDKADELLKNYWVNLKLKIGESADDLLFGSMENLSDIECVTLYQAGKTRAMKANRPGIGHTGQIDHDLSGTLSGICTVHPSARIMECFKGYCWSLGYKYKKQVTDHHFCVTLAQLYSLPNLKLIRCCSKEYAKKFAGHFLLGNYSLGELIEVKLGNQKVNFWSTFHPAYKQKLNTARQTDLQVHINRHYQVFSVEGSRWRCDVCNDVCSRWKNYDDFEVVPENFGTYQKKDLKRDTLVQDFEALNLSDNDHYIFMRGEILPSEMMVNWLNQSLSRDNYIIRAECQGRLGVGYGWKLYFASIPQLHLGLIELQALNRTFCQRGRNERYKFRYWRE